MDRVQLLLLGLPLFLLCTDLISLFSPPPPKAPHHHHSKQPSSQKPLEFPRQKTGGVGGIGLGSTVSINFCYSCSYRGSAVTMKKMLEAAFPGIEVILANHPPTFPKRLVAKLVPVAQMGVIGMVIVGEHVFPMLGIITPPPWYYSLRANRFGTIAATLLLGNLLQSSLQSSGAFEIYYSDELVFSKLKEGRFPGETELKDIIFSKITRSRIGVDVWP